MSNFVTNALRTLAGKRSAGTVVAKVAMYPMLVGPSLTIEQATAQVQLEITVNHIGRALYFAGTGRVL